MDVNKVVKEYYKSNLFVFLPNICNSSCYFCYVSPTKVSKVQLSDNVVENFEILATQSKKIGFETIRITGGEPLVFTNIDKIIQILKSNNLNYTLLSNGQNLFKYFNLISSYLPKKITISFHSVKYYNEIFKNEINFEELFKILKILQLKNIEICISILFLNENKDEIKELTNYLYKNNIHNIKIIYPNNYLFDLFKEFQEISIESSFDQIRITDFNQKKCLLNYRGFLSVNINNLSVYNCCVNIGERNNETICTKNNFNLEEIVIKQYTENIKIKSFPCTTNLKTCPLALKSI